jgi:hypothetical protein
MDGYWQALKYFEGYQIQLNEIFFRGLDLTEYQANIEKEIRSSHSISIHIRRGDYVDNKNAAKVHPLCSLDYYRQAIARCRLDIDGEHKYFIFSDDINWCRENIRVGSNVEYVLNEDCSPLNYIFLMSLCEINIIANSSFSWWGAYLNRKAKKIIAPARWGGGVNLGELICKDWVLIDA